MRLLIDIGHPAHVHLFKHFAHEMQRKGHSILFTCRDKEFEIKLLTEYELSFNSFGNKYKSLLGKIWGLFKFDTQEYYNALRFKPDIFLSHGSMYAAHAAFLYRRPHICFEDTFNFEQIRLYKLFTDVILTSDYENPLTSHKVIKYSGYHELAYLHPKRFLPDISIYEDLGIKRNETFIIIRFVSWNASHDAGHTGITYLNKVKAVHEFSKLAKVFISSESELPMELRKYKFPISPERMHHAIAFSSMMFGESSTMSEEAAMLGVPSVYLFNNSTIYTQHLEKEYGLIYNYSESSDDQMAAIQKGIEILSNNRIHVEWQEKRRRMLNDKIDVTAFMVWFIENYPESKRIMKENPDYQYNFK